jgi:hypothetical protein
LAVLWIELMASCLLTSHLPLEPCLSSYLSNFKYIILCCYDRYWVVQWIPRTYSSCITRTFYPLTNTSPFPLLSVPLQPLFHLYFIMIILIPHVWGSYSVCLTPGFFYLT